MTTVYETLLEQMHENEKRKHKYICPNCGKRNNYYKGSCYDCEAEAERQFEQEHDER